MQSTRPILAVALLFVLLAGPLHAAGFNIYEQGAKPSALAGAWVAQADDAAAAWFNPAALVWLEGSEFQIGTNIIPAGSDTEFTSSDPRFGLSSPTTFEMDTNLVTPSHLYYRHKINNNFALGVAITNPYGLVTDWQDRPVTFSASRSELATFFVNPSLAMRLTHTWSLAVGVSYVYADLKDFGREIPIDLDGNPLNGFEVIGASNLTGDGSDLGWNIALHHKGNGYNFGLTYRSKVDVDIDGAIDFQGFGPLSPFFASSTGSAVLNLPDTAAIGLSWDSASRNWTYELNIAWSGWSTFDTLDVDIDNNVPGFVEDISLREDWDDTFSYRFGATKRTASGNEWRFGFVYDEQTVPDDTLRPSIPDGDRYGPSFGYGLNRDRWSADFYYFPIFFSEASAVGTEEGVIQGEYSSFVQLAGVTFRRRF